MRRRRGGTLIDNAITGSIILILAVILFPVFMRAWDNARRSSCQSNLKHISVALWQYASDNGGRAPLHDWSTPLRPYIKEGRVFRCPAANHQGKGDYFFNARFLKRELGDIFQPQTLVLVGDADSDQPLSLYPTTWRRDKSSPAWRHTNAANYQFADGSIMWLKSTRLDSNFRRVSR